MFIENLTKENYTNEKIALWHNFFLIRAYEMPVLYLEIISVLLRAPLVVFITCANVMWHLCRRVATATSAFCTCLKQSSWPASSLCILRLWWTQEEKNWRSCGCALYGFQTHASCHSFTLYAWNHISICIYYHCQYCMKIAHFTLRCCYLIKTVHWSP